MATDDNTLVSRLLTDAVPEIAAGVIEIKGIARKIGVRCKISLRSHDPQVDCIGACVGVCASRIKQVVDALSGERVDLIRWNHSPEMFIADALQPGAVEQVALHPAQRLAVVTVLPEQAALVRGRRGENCELASELCGWKIEIKERGGDYPTR